MQESELLLLFDTYADMVYRIACSMLKHSQDAEDAVQDVFIKLLEGRAQPIPGKERAFLTRIAVNHCKDMLRSTWKKKTEALDHEIIFEQKEDRELFAMIMRLPAKHRVVIYLHYYEGYNFKEIAGLLGISVSAVSMRVHRGRKVLQKALEEDGNELRLQADV